jgi:hypothetical protein
MALESLPPGSPLLLHFVYMGFTLSCLVPHRSFALLGGHYRMVDMLAPALTLAAVPAAEVRRRVA